MFINIGGEKLNNIEDETSINDQNSLSAHEVLSIDESDPVNVEFVISSNESEDDYYNFEHESFNDVSSNLQDNFKDRNHALNQPVFVPSNGQGAFNRNILKARSLLAVSKCHCQASEKHNKKCDCFDEATPVHSKLDKADASQKSFSSKSPDVHFLSPLKKYKIFGVLRSCLKNRFVKFILILASYICFVCIGAVCFQVIEKPADQQSKKLIKEIIYSLKKCNCLSAQHLHSVLAALSHMPPGKLQYYLLQTKDPPISDQNLFLFDSLRSLSRLLPEDAESWSFGNALIFCMTIVTTIGYGHIVPRSPTGKVFCILFGCIGIPFTLWLSSFAISLLMPLILRWRAATVRWFFAYFPAPHQVISNSNIPCIPAADDVNVGDAETYSNTGDNHRVRPKEEPGSLTKVNSSFVGKVNHSFEESDLINLPSCLNLRRKSKSLTSIHSGLHGPLHLSKATDTARKHTTILLPDNSLLHKEASVDHEVPATTVRPILSRSHYPLISKASVFLNPRSRHVSVLQPPLTMKEKLHVLLKSRSTKARLLHLLLVVVLVCILIIFLPAYVFFRLEPGWSYIDAIYFCFISLTTIGFGDFVPGRVPSHINVSTIPHPYSLLHEFYCIAIVVYLIGGTTMLMMLVRVYREMMEVERRIKRDRLVLKLQHSLTDPNLPVSNNLLFIPAHS